MAQRNSRRQGRGGRGRRAATISGAASGAAAGWVKRCAWGRGDRSHGFQSMRPFSHAVPRLSRGRSLGELRCAERGVARTRHPPSPPGALLAFASATTVPKVLHLLGALPHLAALALKAPGPLLLPLPPELGPRLLVRVRLVRHGRHTLGPHRNEEKRRERRSGRSEFHSLFVALDIASVPHFIVEIRSKYEST